ncbi:MAG: hypothetical protein K4H23_05440, partial [Mollicutes bacterium PWAP]|nr:hypothetical protein [Mollicutes bacterium PWAP]
IYNRAPKVMNIYDIINSFVSHNKKFTKNITNFKLKKWNKRLEIIIGLIKVRNIIDEVIEVIRKTFGRKKEVIKNLILNFEFSEIQATAIAELRLHRLNSTNEDELTKEKNEIEENIIWAKKILNEENFLNENIIKKLKEIKKEFGVPRKTKIIKEDFNITINKEDLIKKENVFVSITERGYLKKLSNRIVISNDLSSFGIVEDDILFDILFTNTINKILAFTDKGNVMIVDIYKIFGNNWKNSGSHINELTKMNPDEKIIKAFIVEDFELDLNIISLSNSGKVKKTILKEFNFSRKSKSYKYMNLKKDERVTSLAISNGTQEIIIVSNSSMTTKFNEEQISSTSLKSSGIMGIKLKQGEYAVSVSSSYDHDNLTFVSKRGSYKRLRVSEISSSGRNTRGKSSFAQTKSTPNLITSSKNNFRSGEILVNTDLGPKKVLFQINRSNINNGFSNPTNDFKLISLNKFEIINKDIEILKNKIERKPKTLENAEESLNEIQLKIDSLLKG